METLGAREEGKCPNILFAISDDQSYDHTSFAGSTFVNTPAFDRIAEEGVYFTNCIAGSPGCAPSRSALVTGRHHWQNEQSGQHASAWLKKHVPFIDEIRRNGYYVGRTGKGVGPFQYARDESDSQWREGNAAGPELSDIRYGKEGHEDRRPTTRIGPSDYFSNFENFLENRPDGAPFFFWYGGTEPHRRYEKGSWKRSDKRLTDVQVPGFLPDNDVIRGDLLDYALEIEWFDLHLMRMLRYLEEKGELENTIVIVTADNGMPFPRAKANCFDYGVRVPLAIRFPKAFPGARVIDDPVRFIDFAPTLLELTRTKPEEMLAMRGKSIAAALSSKKSGSGVLRNQYAFSGRERHSSSRHDNWGYPQRAIRSERYLLVWNAKPERWPAGAPQCVDPEDSRKLLPLYGMNETGEHVSEWAFTDIDASPSKSHLVEEYVNKGARHFLDLAVGKRPQFELYDVQADPYCLRNLAGNESHAKQEAKLKKALFAELKQTNDPRVVGPDKEVFDSYLRYSPMREFPAPSEAEMDELPKKSNAAL
ncbi:sulfatase [Pelagicoccus sp. SDUM812002]|uniref:sulfatase family protein n=1 Tax=Pelagicoccus sp. SDUM812002 TaxID=3041266 RepID=UPI00281165FD|nr:sulfatase [Pelagicoccus sp. SDUM812002]